MPLQLEPTRPHGVGRDALWAGAIFVAGLLSYTAAVRTFWAHGGVSEFYQDEFAPAVLDACGRGFARPISLAGSPTALDDFLSQRRASLTCADLEAVLPTSPIDRFQGAHRYLLLLVASIWRVSGVSWTALAWLAGLLGGSSLALGYLFFRFGAGRATSAALTILWGMSPFQLGQIPHLRDYSKAPFFLLTVCLTAYLARYAVSPARTGLLMVLAGAALGFGIGMRTDVALYLPAIVVALLLFRPGPRLHDLPARVACAALAVILFVIVARPVLKMYQTGNNLAHVAILGLSDASNDWLQLNPGPYSFGYLHDDGFVATTVAAYEDRAHASPALVRVGTAPYARASNEYYGRLMKTFPADILTRAWASVARVLTLPFDDKASMAPSWMPGPLGRLYAWRAAVMSPFGAIALAAAFAFAVGLSTWNLRLGMLFVIYVAGFAGISAVQFHERNVFHLEILPFWIFGCLGTALWHAWTRRRQATVASVVARLRPASLIALALVVGIAAPVWAARRYQTGTVRRLIDAYDAAALQTADSGEFASVDSAGGLLPIPSLSSASRPSRAVLSDMLAVDIGGISCDYDVVNLTFRYATAAPFSDFSAARQIPVPGPEEPPARVHFPVYSLGSAYSGPRGLEFRGIEVPVEQRACVARAGTFKDPEAFPLLLETVLSPGWRTQRLYQTFRGLESADVYAPRLVQAYAAPETFSPGRKLRTALEPVTAAPAYQARIVSRGGNGQTIVRGTAEGSGSYLLSWPAQGRRGGSAFFVEGELLAGGLTVGTQQNERWLRLVNVSTAGPFHVAVRVDEDGIYEAVIANHLLEGSLRNHFTLSRIGWLPPAPSVP